MKKLLSLSILLLSLIVVSTTYALETGEVAPDFELQDVEGKKVKLSDFAGKNVVLEWYNKGCPFVKKHYKQGDMQALQAEAIGKGFVWILINSTRVDHKDYLSPVAAKKTIAEQKISASYYLLDASGNVGRLYGAKTTPHMFVIGSDGVLKYQGAIDDTKDVFVSPKEAKNYISRVIEEISSGSKISLSDSSPYGCSVKYAK